MVCLETLTAVKSNDFADPRRTKRTVQYKDPEDVWNYIGRGKRLPGACSLSTLHSEIRELPSLLFSAMEHVALPYKKTSACTGGISVLPFLYAQCSSDVVHQLRNFNKT
jgi:hypothetical protein